MHIYVIYIKSHNLTRVGPHMLPSARLKGYQFTVVRVLTLVTLAQFVFRVEAYVLRQA